MNAITRPVYITDVTLREWDQAPLTGFNAKEKAMIALMLSELWVDVIEVGFWSSRADFENIREVAKVIGDRDVIISSLWRAIESDTIASLNALEWVKNPRIHIFLAMSRDHINWKFAKAWETLEERQAALLEKAITEIKRAKEWWKSRWVNLEIEFSPEDATWNSRLEKDWKKYFSLKNNPDFDFLVKVCEEAIKNGAKIINVPDTLWNLLPHQTYEFFKELKERLSHLEESYDFWLSCHIHNDKGTATANALEAIRWWAKYIESTIKWIWERAWNTFTEEIIPNLNESWEELWVESSKRIKTEVLWPVCDFTMAILQLDKSLQSPFIWVLSNVDWAWVHNANWDLYGWSKDKERYGGANMPEFFSPRWWASQIVFMLWKRWVSLDKSSETIQNITQKAAKESEVTRALFVDNIYRLYLEEVKNFKIEKIDFDSNSIDVAISINWERIEFKWNTDWENWVVKTFIQLLNLYLWKDIIEIQDLQVKSRADMLQEYRKFEKRASIHLSEDFRMRVKTILNWLEEEDWKSAVALSQVVLDINWNEINSISYDHNTTKSTIKSILEWALYLIVSKFNEK